MKDDEACKSNRKLSIYSRLMNGRTIVKAEEAKRFGLSEKSIQRDIEEIRKFLDVQAYTDGIPNYLIYDHQIKAYAIEQPDNLGITNDEMIALFKILFSSRAFSRTELNSIINKLVDCCIPKKNQKDVNDLILEERFFYNESRERSYAISMMMTLARAVKACCIIEFYCQTNTKSGRKKHRIMPLSVVFEANSFYLSGITLYNIHKADLSNKSDSNLMIVKVDSIQDLSVTTDHFEPPYRNKYEEEKYRQELSMLLTER